MGLSLSQLSYDIPIQEKDDFDQMLWSFQILLFFCVSLCSVLFLFFSHFSGCDIPNPINNITQNCKCTAEIYWDFVLQESDFFSTNGFPKQPFPNGWKGKSGLYAAGFSRRGLSGVSIDATRIADDIGQLWKEEIEHRSVK